jgi:hypothetical protein
MNGYRYRERKTNKLGENLSQCYFVHRKSQWTDLGTNLTCCSEKPAANHLSYGTAYYNPFMNIPKLYLSR